jgi:hypothetical protein
MRNLPVILALALLAALPQAALAGDAAPGRSPEPAEQSLLGARLPELLKKFEGGLVSKARAAECIAEGEPCTANDQCCPGLQCVGGPPTVCSTEE